MVKFRKGMMAIYALVAGYDFNRGRFYLAVFVYGSLIDFYTEVGLIVVQDRAVSRRDVNCHVHVQVLFSVLTTHPV